MENKLPETLASNPEPLFTLTESQVKNILINLIEGRNPLVTFQDDLTKTVALAQIKRLACIQNIINTLMETPWAAPILNEEIKKRSI